MRTSLRVRRVQLGSTLSGVSEVMRNKQAFGFAKGHEATRLRDGTDPTRLPDSAGTATSFSGAGEGAKTNCVCLANSPRRLLARALHHGTAAACWDLASALPADASACLRCSCSPSQERAPICAWRLSLAAGGSDARCTAPGACRQEERAGPCLAGGCRASRGLLRAEHPLPPWWAGW